MSITQHTRDWDARFRAGDTPWEDDGVAPSVVDLVEAPLPDGARVLEVGCGVGTTTLWLAQHGYQVVACDVSAEAIRITEQRAAAAHLPLRAHVPADYSAVFGVAPADPRAIAGASLLLLCIAAVAAGIPAHRASRLDPTVALQE